MVIEEGVKNGVPLVKRQGYFLMLIAETAADYRQTQISYLRLQIVNKTILNESMKIKMCLKKHTNRIP